MAYSLHFMDWRGPTDGRDAPSPAFQVRLDGEYHFPVRVRLSELFVGMLVDGFDGSPEEARQRTEQSILRWSVRRIEEELATGSINVPEQTIDFQVIETTEEDRAAIETLMTQKSCGYQLRSDRDLYCSASAPTDDTNVGTSGLKFIAPTSMPICVGCQLPPDEVMCDHLVHPQVLGIVTFGGWERSLGRALCERGRDEVEDPSRCCADGHDCWSRALQTDVEEPVRALTATALPEAFDYLGAIWRLVFGKPLLRLISAKDVAGIAQPCSTRTEFEECVTDLADIVANLSVADEHLPTELDADQRNGSLNRLEASLSNRLEGEAQARAVEAVATLRRITTLRNGFGHSGAAKKLPTAFAELGLAYPPASWSSAWDQLRSRTIRALAAIRDELSTLME